MPAPAQTYFRRLLRGARGMSTTGSPLIVKLRWRRREGKRRAGPGRTGSGVAAECVALHPPHLLARGERPLLGPAIPETNTRRRLHAAGRATNDPGGWRDAPA